MTSCRRLLFVWVVACIGVVCGGAASSAATEDRTLAGRVVEASGAGVAGCSVLVRALREAEDNAAAASWRTTTDAAGRFVVTLDEPALVEVVVGPSRGDAPASSRRCDREERRIGPLPVVRSVVLPTWILSAGGAADGIDRREDLAPKPVPLRWRSGAATRRATVSSRSIAGRVVGARDGLPIVGAWVWSGVGVDEVTRSGAEGRFTIDVADGVRHLDIAAVGHLWRRVEVPTGAEPIDVPVALDATIRGVGEVRDLDDRPIAGATVRIVSRPVARSLPDAVLGLGAEPRLTRTDTAGRFEVDDLPPAWLDLAATADGFAPFDVPGVELASPAAPETVADLGVLVLDRGVAWSARLIDIDGVPLLGVPARFRRVGVDTEWSAVVDGTIALQGLVVGRRLDLEVRADGYRPAVVSIVPEVADPIRSVVLTPMRSIHGQVVEASGSAIAARVDVLGGDLAGGPRAVETAPDGRFEIAAAGGRLVLVASRPGFGTTEPVVVRLGADDEPVDEVRLRLRPEKVVEGRLGGPDGEPVSGAELVAEQLAGDGTGPSIPVAWSTSDADGSFRLVGLAAGTVRVVAEHPELGSTEQSLDLATDATVQSIELAYPPGWPLTGRVTDRLGRPVSGARLRLRSSAHGVRRAVVDAAGTFVLRHAAPGEYRLTVEADGFATPPPRVVKLDARSPADVAIVLDAGATVRVRVHGLELEQLADVEIEARARLGGARSARPDHRGQARVGPLAPGEWTLTAHLDDGRRRAVAVVEVPSVESPNASAGPGGALVADLIFGRGVALGGRILHRRQPVSGARLLLLPDRGMAIATATDADGRFALHDLTPGAYRMEIESAVLAVRAARTIDLTADRELDIALDGVD